MNGNMRKETAEAIAAGERALSSLREARDALNSARNWGIIDLFGGGFITDLIKHSKLDRAASYVEEAKYAIRCFEQELRDVQIVLDLRGEFGGFLSFADFFFDGLVADYLVQSRIADARRQIEDAIEQVAQVLGRLRRMYEY